MDESRILKFRSAKYDVTPIKAIPGHFATNHSHINYYIDLTTMKSRISEAKQAAEQLAQQYVATTLVDTIVCLDGTEVIGTFMAQKLTEAGFMSTNAHGTIYVVRPERADNSQLIFRENAELMIRGKNIIILMASVTTGLSIRSMLDCLDYYGGVVQGVSCLFSAVAAAEGMDVHSLFTTSDIPGYASYSNRSCPLCQRGVRLEALVNSYGYSML